MLDVPDQHGLVCGYRVDPGGVVRNLDRSDIDEALAADGTLVWLHFDQADARARTWIEGCELLPRQARALLLATSGSMRLEPVGSGIAGAIGDLHHEVTDDAEKLGMLRLYLDHRILISARRTPLAAVDKLRRAIREGLKADRPIILVSEFLHHVTDTLGDLIVGLTEVVDGCEDILLDGEDSRSWGDDLGRVRRLGAKLRRHMIPQQHALGGLLARLPSWVEEAEASRLTGAIERLAALGHDLDLVLERARLMQEQLSARLAEATNRNLYTLSIVTSIFLPITLITGMFGMNLGGLPWQQDPLGFWYGLGVMGVTVAVTVLLLRLRRML